MHIVFGRLLIISVVCPLSRLVFRATMKVLIKMPKNIKFIAISLIVLLASLAIFLLVKNDSFVLLHPKGLLAIKERDLMITVVSIMLIVALPLYLLTLYIAVKYREGNKNNSYTPDKTAKPLLIVLWWVVPTVIVLILAVINWNNSHALDPFKPLNAKSKPITIQVIALRWKWLFIYPEQNLATVNFIEFPVDTPVNFELSADAPMSSFWIPSLSGQIYAMTGMGTKLHVIANKPGDYTGSAAEINGKGFAGMRFIARAGSKSEYDSWITQTKESQRPLNMATYNQLAEPTEDNPVEYFSPVEPDLYNKIIDKFLPQGGHENH